MSVMTMDRALFQGVIFFLALLTSSFAGKLALSGRERAFVERCVCSFEGNAELGACATFLGTAQNIDETDFTSSPNPMDYMVRTVTFWDPLRECHISCSECGGDLIHKPDRSFSCDTTYHPGYAMRLIYCVQDQVILVTAVYACSDCKETSNYGTDPRILQEAERAIQVPYILTHRSGATCKFVNLLTSCVNHGIQIQKFRSILAEQYNFRHWQRQEQYRARTQHRLPVTHTDEANTPFPDFDESTLPGRHLLEQIYLQEVKTNRLQIEQSRRETNIDYLTCDHTFKISTKIGYFHPITKRFVKQYSSLFCVLNGQGQILEWRLSPSTKFLDIKPLLENIKDRAPNNIDLVCIDNCCHWANMLRDVFGAQVQVKLDLFHACQRFTRSIKKTCKVRGLVIREFRMVFRQPTDLGKTRKQTTPSKDIILENWHGFFEKWHTRTSNGTNVLGQRSLLELKKLKRHIETDCLSNIPVGAGTGRNERLHSVLNSHGILRSPTVGLPLADSAIASCFHSINTRKRKKDLTYTPPFALQGDGKVRQTDTGGRDKGASTQEHYSAQQPTSEDDLMKKGESLLTELLETSLQGSNDHDYANNLPTAQLLIVRNAIAKAKVLKYIRMKSGHCPMVNDTKLFFSSLYKSLQHDPQVTSFGINSTLESWGFNRTPVRPDGNCLFRAITKSVKSQMQQLRGTEFVAILENLGINPDRVEEDVIVDRLRSLVVQEFLDNYETYIHAFMSPDNYFEMVEQISQSGIYDLAIGDAVLLAICNVLQTTTTVFSNIQGMPVFSVTPTSIAAHTAPTIFVVFDQSHAHYDAVTPIDSHCNVQQEFEKNISCTSTPTTTKSDIGGDVVTKSSSMHSCSCGKNVKERGQDKKHCKILKCACYRHDVACTNSCRCKGCDNNKPSTKRKQPKLKHPHQPQVHKQTSLQVIEQSPDKPKRGTLSDLERCLLSEIYLKHGEDSSAKDILQIYNGLIQAIGEVAAILRIEPLTLSQVASFLSRKKSEVKVLSY